MRPLLSTALAFVLFASSPAVAQPPDRSAPAGPATAAIPAINDPLLSGISHLQRAEYAEAVTAFERALDSYAEAKRLDAAKRAYMEMFIGNRGHASVLMRAMRTWVQKHRADAAGLATLEFAAFDSWVQERDALAAATTNLAHNSPDWK